MRTAIAYKSRDGFMPAVSYPDGTERILENTIYPDGVSAVARAREMEEAAFASAKLTAEKAAETSALAYAGYSLTEEPRSHRPGLIPVNTEPSVRVTRIVIDPKTVEPVLPWLRKATFAILGLQVMLGALLGAVLAGG